MARKGREWKGSILVEVISGLKSGVIGDVQKSEWEADIQPASTPRSSNLRTTNASHPDLDLAPRSSVEIEILTIPNISTEEPEPEGEKWHSKIYAKCQLI